MYHEAGAAGRKAWTIVPKLHLFLHLCEVQATRYDNPRFYWTYADEDMVGHMIEAAWSCHASTMPEVALFKFLALTFDVEARQGA